MKILILIAIAVIAMFLVAWLLPWWVTITLVGVLSIWLVGWLVTAFYQFFFDPLRPSDETPEHRRGRRAACLAINLVLWPFMLSQLRPQFRFHRDIQTGKRPAWLVLAEGEATSQEWVTMDGWAFWVSADAGSSAEPTRVQVLHDTGNLASLIECRVRMIAPTPGDWSEWRPMNVRTETESPNEYEEEEDEDADQTCYEASFDLVRGKYEASLRVQSRAGEMQECPDVTTIIVSDPEDYPF